MGVGAFVSRGTIKGRAESERRKPRRCKRAGQVRQERCGLLPVVTAAT